MPELEKSAGTNPCLTLGVLKMKHLPIIAEKVGLRINTEKKRPNLLNAGDAVGANLLQDALQLLLVRDRCLVHNLLLAAGSALERHHFHEINTPCHQCGLLLEV